MRRIKSVKYFCIMMLCLFILFYYVKNSFAVKVEFKYKSDNAISVSVAGSFNNWNKNANKMKKGKDNIWHTKIDLPPGRYEYKFVINGNRWVEDPNAKEYVKDPYGGRNSVIVVEPKLSKNDKPPFKYVNLTGSFNNWNQADKNYIMKYIGDKTYEIVKLFYPGKYEFKFNMNKTWNINYGKGDSGENSLKQNGDNIKFFAKDLGFYRIRLYLSYKKYDIKKIEPLKSVAYVKYSPFYYLGDTIVLDGSKSISPKGIHPKFFWKESKNNKIKLSRKDLYKSKIKFKAEKVGSYKYTLIIKNDKKSIPYDVSFKVINRYSLVGKLTSTDSSNSKTFLKYKGQGLYEKIIYTKKSGRYVFRLIKNFKYNVMDAFNFKLKKNRYYLFSYNEKEDRFNFERKNFARFYFDPKEYRQVKGKIVSVAVAGDFNNWNTEADLLEKQDDGTFLLYKPLDEGVYHYKFVVNGTQWLYDLNSPENLKVSDGYGGFNSGIFVGERGDEFGGPVKNGINWDAVEHNINETKYFNVIGKRLIQIKIRTIANDVDQVLLVYYAPKKKKIAKLKVKENKFGFDYFSTIITLKPKTQFISYYFVLIDKSRKYYFGDDYYGKELPPADKRFGFRIYVKFPTPDWAKGIIWYQIMVDRFRNGDKSNDPDCTLPWRWDWFKKYKCEKWDDKRFMDKRYGFYGWEGVWNRFYGGDLQGLMEKLQYLKDLGVGGIYLNPIFESPSYHKYDTADYRHIDDNFGYKGDNKNLNETLSPSTWKWTKTDKLFLKFLKKAHKMGFKVIIDGVFNHSGDNFWAFKDVRKRKNLSPYKDWFIISSWNPFKYEGWAGFGGLPVYREDENGLVHGIREHIFNITKRWMDPNDDGDPSDGIDGWRLDVPNEVNHNFWKDWRKLVKRINPNAYITGEIWEKATPWLKGDQFDAVMNYEFAKLVYRFFINTSKKYSISPSEFDKQIKDLLSSYPMQVDFVMQNLLDSHDTDRILSGIKNPNRYFDAKNRVQDNPNYDNSKYGEKEIRIYKLIQIFQFTFVGSPMIYYGDEVGMWGADDPNNRKPMWWEDLMPYDNPEYKISYDILKHTKLLARIRNSNSALKNGIFDTLVIDDKNQIYGFIRSNDMETLYIILNRGKSSQKVTIKVESAKKKVKDLITGKTYKVKKGKVTLRIPSIDGVILK